MQPRSWLRALTITWLLGHQPPAIAVRKLGTHVGLRAEKRVGENDLAMQCHTSLPLVAAWLSGCLAVWLSTDVVGWEGRLGYGEFLFLGEDVLYMTLSFR